MLHSNRAQFCPVSMVGVQVNPPVPVAVQVPLLWAPQPFGFMDCQQLSGEGGPGGFVIAPMHKEWEVKLSHEVHDAPAYVQFVAPQAE